MKMKTARLLLLLLILPGIVQAQSGHSMAIARFEERVANALEAAQVILNQTRDLPRLAHLETNHTYQDKFLLAETLTNIAVSAMVQTLHGMVGLDDHALETVLKWVHQDGSSVRLELSYQEDCKLESQQDKEVVDHETEKVTETVEVDSQTGSTERVRSKVIRKVKEYVWKLGLSYQLRLCAGSTSCDGDDDSARVLVLRSNTISTTLTTASKNSPMETSSKSKQYSVDLTWLFQMLSVTDDDGKIARPQFAIDRSDESCKTPRRNDQVEMAMNTFSYGRFSGPYGFWPFLFEQSEHDIEDSISFVSFNPLLPLMENQTILSTNTVNRFLQEHNNSIQGLVKTISDRFPAESSEKNPISATEATLVWVLRVMDDLASQYRRSIQYIEDMLGSQLIQAVGKEVRSDDFDQFIRVYNQKIFGAEYAPTPFSYAVRQPNEYPVGTVSLENAIGANELIQTSTKHITDGPAIRVPINAATSVEMTGDIYLSGWMETTFQEGIQRSTRLAARARQFSSFLVLVGTMSGPDKFDPKHGIILRNNDEVLIPLITESLPSAKEFQDAIQSLSPEQQAFAKAFRGVQLESSVFGVCVVQLRPQLETLLGLPNGALTKEIQLTQDLMSLFVDYQIPPDLLSFDGASSATVAEKVAVVKQYVKAVMDVIEATREKQLADEKQKAEAKKAYRWNSDDSFHAAEEDVMESASFFSASADVPSLSSAPSATPSSVPSGTSRLFEEFNAEGGRRSLRQSATAVADDGAASSSSFEPSEASTVTPQDSSASISTSRLDFTMLPKVLDAKLQVHDTDGYLRSTIIQAGPTWTRRRQENLLSPTKKSNLYREDLDAEKKKALDLLDAISRSGTLPIEHSELHVIMAVTHRFEKSVISTLIEDNINPIEKIEKSMLLLASTIHGSGAPGLVGDGEVKDRLAKSFPALFTTTVAGSIDDASEESNGEEGVEVKG